jgi:hypothetical protein
MLTSFLCFVQVPLPLLRACQPNPVRRPGHHLLLHLLGAAAQLALGRLAGRLGPTPTLFRNCNLCHRGDLCRATNRKSGALLFQGCQMCFYVIIFDRFVSF